MPRVSPNTLKRLQKDSSCIRNICILAHVDHGKTSLSDSLLASNGIISQKLAGEVRFLDSRPDEQSRGITMESSAISLYFRVLHKQEGTNEPLIDEHLINLIDSPGHIDFSSEVSAASRLCDGALVLVDVVGGVCSQTVTVLRQCWIEKLKPILILNKVDRLIIELQLTALEAYKHLCNIIEQVNSVLGSFYAGDKQLDHLSWREQLESDAKAEFTERDDSDIYFDPSKNNVIFSSATDGWGFTVDTFAKVFEQKLGVDRKKLKKVLWGDYCLNPKTKKIICNKELKGKKFIPLFVSLILENIWKIYKVALTSRDSDMLEKITKSLNVKILSRDLKSKNHKNLLRSIMSQWLPVSTAVLLTVVTQLPSPLDSQKVRIDAILGSMPNDDDDSLISSIRECDSSGPICAYVSKMISISKDELPVEVNNDEDGFMQRTNRARKEALRAAELAEKLSKTHLVSKDDVYAHANDNYVVSEIGSMKDHCTDCNLTSAFEVEKVVGDVNFLKNSSNRLLPNCIDHKIEDRDESYELAPSIPDGINLNDAVTSMIDYETENQFNDQLSEKEEDENNEVSIGFARLYSGTLKVGQKIQILDPRYDLKKPTEHVQIATISSLYLFMGKELVPLESCTSGNVVGIGGLAGKLLKNGTILELDSTKINLAAIQMNNNFIVKVALEPVRPTQMNKLVHGLKLLNQADPCVETYTDDSGELILCTAGELHLERCLKDLKERFAKIEISCSQPAIPYRETILKVSDMNPPANADLGRGVSQVVLGDLNIRYRCLPLPHNVTQFLIENEKNIKNYLRDENVRAKDPLTSESFIDHLRKELEKHTEYSEYISISYKFSSFGPKRTGPNLLILKNISMPCFNALVSESGLFDFEDSIINGFQLAVFSGPLANEPIQGIAVVVEIIELLNQDYSAKKNSSICKEALLDFPGKLITTTRDTIHRCFLDWSPRIMWAMYTSEIQASVEVLGKVYAVVQQRRGRIVSEELKEGTPFFQVTAKIPVIEAFGFSEDIRKRSSGAAQPQLVFSGFECIDMDPFWVPTTENELEELGHTADKENIARKHMNNIRRRKGLFIEEKIVEKAEKQRTLKRN